MSDLALFTVFAHRLADEVRPILKRYFRQPLAIDSKPDATPVTLADREAEERIRELLRKDFPDHGIRGEEFGTTNAEAEYCWVIDPIDGTRAFITGKPTFTTLIALLHRGTPIVGLIDQPLLEERWIATSETTTCLNGSPMKTSQNQSLKEAYLTATSPHMFSAEEFPAFEALRAACRQAVYGSDAYGYACLAGGHLDLAVEADMKPHDYLPLIPIVERAGGVITDWKGEKLTLQSDGRILAAANRALHGHALHYLEKTP